MRGFTAIAIGVSKMMLRMIRRQLLRAGYAFNTPQPKFHLLPGQRLMRSPFCLQPPERFLLVGFGKITPALWPASGYTTTSFGAVECYCSGRLGSASHG